MFYRIVLTCTVFLGTAFLPAIAHAISLEEATYTAIENSPAVRQAIAKYRESKESVDIARRSGYYPGQNLEKKSIFSVISF